MNGRKLYYVSKLRDKVSGYAYIIEDELIIHRFMHFLEAGDGASVRCLVFIAKNGGQRTVPVADIVTLR